MAGLNFLAGKLGLLLALPPGFASPIWLPSGIALAFVLIHGNRVWPGIWLGSFLLNLSAASTPDASIPLLHAAAIAAEIGIGSTLQALAGAFLVRRFVDFPCALVDGGEVARFLLLAGPAACLLGATLGTGALWFAGIVDQESMAANAATWWVGDSIGVLIATPLVLCWLGEPTAVWRPRRSSVAVPVAGCLVLAGLTYTLADRWEERWVRTAFDRRADSMAWSLEKEFATYRDAIETVASFYRATDAEIDAAGFRTLVEPILSRCPAMRAMSWNPFVPEERRESFEASAGIEITERDSEGRLARATRRDAYVVVQLIEPGPRNEGALGYDVYSEPTRREALDRAIEANTPIATAPICLVQDPAGPLGVLIFLPVYATPSGLPGGTDRRSSIRGFATGVLSVPEVIDAANPEDDRGWIRIAFHDDGERDAGRSSPVDPDARGPAAIGGELRCVRKCTTVGREWTLRFSAARRDLGGRPWGPWIVLAAGLAIASLLSGFLLALTGRAASLRLAVTELVDVHGRLQASEECFRTLVEGLPAVTYVSPVEPLFSGPYTSPQIDSLLGFEIEEWNASPRSWERRLHPEDRDRILASRSRSFDDGQPFVEEYRLLDRGGQSVWVRDHGRIRRDAGGRTIACQGVMIDITDAKRAEARLRAQCAVARALAESETIEEAAGRILAEVGSRLGWAAGAFWTPVPGEDLLRVSRTWSAPRAGLEVFEAEGHGASLSTSEEPPGRAWMTMEPEWVPDLARYPVSSRAEAARRRGLRCGMWFPVALESERLALFEFFGWEPVPVDDDHLDTCRSIGRQLGQFMARVRDARELRDSEERFRQMAENVRETFFLVDPGMTRCFYVSPACESILGRPREQLLRDARAWMDFVHPDDRERVVRTALEMGAAGREHEQEYRLVRADGSIRWVRSVVSPVRDREGRVVRMAGIVEDLTPLKEAEAARLALESELHQVRKMEAIGRLAGGVAHDFNNLLTVIGGSADLIAEALRPADPLREEVGAIRAAADRAATLTRQLLAFSRKQVLAPRVVDLSELVSGMADMLRRLVGTSIDLSTRLDPAIERVRVDPGQMDQVLLNLAINARDAMPGGGRLSIETSSVLVLEDDTKSVAPLRPGRHTCLVVADTGCGMPPEMLAHVFEPFFTTKAAGKGTGFGLSIVYGIVTQSGGHISVASEPGRGTSFRILFPTTREAPEPEPDRKAALRPAVGRGATLLVEDEESIRNLAARILRQAGHEVFTAANGEEALSFCEQHPAGIDVLVTDLVMPGLGGRELAEQLARRRPGIRTVFLSGYTGDDVVRERIGDRGVSFLPKPFSAEDLCRAVQLAAPLRRPEDASARD